MTRIMWQLVFALAATLLVTFVSTAVPVVKAQPSWRLAASPYDLVNAVNALRASYGLAPYSISSVLMTTAQNQADYMAATGHASHTGAAGSSVTDRLLAAGYPLDGDLSLGGLRSENITSGAETMSAHEAVNHWSEDSLHLTTMISASLTEIGAGMSVNNGRVYYVIDCARPTNSGVPQAQATAGMAGSAVPTSAGVIIPVVVSTPNPDGDLIHEVKAGQTLWQIAISYNTKIDEIKRLNNLFDNNIYPGTKFLIQKSVIPTATVPTEAAAPVATFTPIRLPTLTATISAPTLPSTPFHSPRPTLANNIMEIVIGILAVAILGGSMVAWLGTIKK